jgi:hypothetical protein
VQDVTIIEIKQALLTVSRTYNQTAGKDIGMVDANFLTNMDAVKIEVELENSLPSVASTATTQLNDTEHESEEDVPVPFIFVDVNVS